MAAIRHSIQRGTPFGSAPWIKRAARRLGLESTLRPRGRPPKGKKLNVPFVRPGEHVYCVSQAGVLVHNTCSSIGRKFDGPIHHIASDKDKLFTPRFQKLFDDAGLSLQSPWNRMRLAGHVGPHGKFYNQLVYDHLRNAVGALNGPAARNALINELKAIRRDIRYNGWDALLKAPESRVDVLGNF